MKRNTVAAHATTNRPNRILVLLAAAWMILALALGGAVTAESRDEAAAETVISATQP